MTDEELQKFMEETEGVEDRRNEEPEESETAEPKKGKGRLINILLIVVLIACICGVVAYTLSRRKPAVEVSTGDAAVTTTTKKAASNEPTTVVTTAAVSETPEPTSQDAPETTTESEVTEPTTVSPDGEYFIYKIRLGDDFFSVLSNSGINPSIDNVFKLMEYNNMYDGIELKVGMEIRVPTYLRD